MLSEKLIKIVGWIFFILLLIGYCLFQRPLLLNTYADYGVSDLTIVCLAVVLCLLPYSLAHRLKLGKAWYSLAFWPSMAIVAIICNEHIGWRTIALTAAMLAVWLYLVIKRPSLQFKPFNLNIWSLIVAALFCYAIGNTDLFTHYRHQMQRHLMAGDYEKVLQVGSRTSDVDCALFNLRATAMVNTHQLADKLFHYPVPDKYQASDIKYQTSDPDVMLCNLLLQKKLNDFVRLLPHFYDTGSKSLPQHYKEALILYKSRTTNPQINYSNTIVETNYADFLTEKKRYTSPAESKRRCYDLYSNTYFWYYYFH